MYFWYSLGSYQYSSKLIQWGAKEAGSFLHHRLFTTREKWTIFFCQINNFVWFTINRGQYIENRPGIMIFTQRNSVCPCPDFNLKQDQRSNNKSNGQGVKKESTLVASESTRVDSFLSRFFLR